MKSPINRTSAVRATGKQPGPFCLIPAMQRTLIFHHGALGDTVLIWPLLRSVVPCTFISHRGKADLAARFIDKVDSADGDTAPWAWLFGDDAIGRLDDRFKAALAERVRRVVSFVSDGRDTWSQNVQQLCPRAAVAYVQPRPPADARGHVSLFHRHQLASQSVPIGPTHPTIRRNPAGPIVIHPGSGGREKCWPAERFDQLIDHLRHRGLPVVLVIGEAERERFDSPLLQRWGERLDLRQPRSLVELGDLIDSARLFIGNDAGPTHLAGQLGIPTVALFGPSDPRVWAPVGPAVCLVSPEHPAAMRWLHVDTVINALPIHQ